jgi:hypothetical protein
MAAMRAAVTDAFIGPASLEIAREGKEIVFRSADAEIRRLRTDGKKSKDHGVSRKASWKEARFVVETRTRPFKIEESYSVDPETDRLIVDVRGDRRGFDKDITVRRVYERVAEGPPETPRAAEGP